MHYLLLALAIVAEVVGTICLVLSDQFTRFYPSVMVLFSYAAAFYLMSWTVKVLSVGIVYAIWSGAGIALISVVGHFAFSQRLDLPAVVGICLILTGIVVIQLFSSATHH